MKNMKENNKETWFKEGGIWWDLKGEEEPTRQRAEEAFQARGQPVQRPWGERIRRPDIGRKSTELEQKEQGEMVGGGAWLLGCPQEAPRRHHSVLGERVTCLAYEETLPLLFWSSGLNTVGEAEEASREASGSVSNCTWGVSVHRVPGGLVPVQTWSEHTWHQHFLPAPHR